MYLSERSRGVVWFAKEFDLILTRFTDVHALVTCKVRSRPNDRPFCSQTVENCIEYRLRRYVMAELRLKGGVLWFNKLCD